jgi:hypothetical protein
MHDDFASVGAGWEEVPELGEEAFSTSVFPVGNAIQRVVIFRAHSVCAAVHYTDDASTFDAGDAIDLARRMERRAFPSGLMS